MLDPADVRSAKPCADTAMGVECNSRHDNRDIAVELQDVSKDACRKSSTTEHERTSFGSYLNGAGADSNKRGPGARGRFGQEEIAAPGSEASTADLTGKASWSHDASARGGPENVVPQAASAGPAESNPGGDSCPACCPGAFNPRPGPGPGPALGMPPGDARTRSDSAADAPMSARWDARGGLDVLGGAPRLGCSGAAGPAQKDRDSETRTTRGDEDPESRWGAHCASPRASTAASVGHGRHSMDLPAGRAYSDRSLRAGPGPGEAADALLGQRSDALGEPEPADRSRQAPAGFSGTVGIFGPGAVPLASHGSLRGSHHPSRAQVPSELGGIRLGEARPAAAGGQGAATSNPSRGYADSAESESRDQRRRADAGVPRRQSDSALPQLGQTEPSRATPSRSSLALASGGLVPGLQGSCDGGLGSAEPPRTANLRDERPGLQLDLRPGHPSAWHRADAARWQVDVDRAAWSSWGDSDETCADYETVSGGLGAGPPRDLSPEMCSDYDLVLHMAQPEPDGGPAIRASSSAAGVRYGLEPAGCPPRPGTAGPATAWDACHGLGEVRAGHGAAGSWGDLAGARAVSDAGPSEGTGMMPGPPAGRPGMRSDPTAWSTGGGGGSGPRMSGARVAGGGVGSGSESWMPASAGRGPRPMTTTGAGDCRRAEGGPPDGDPKLGRPPLWSRPRQPAAPDGSWAHEAATRTASSGCDSDSGGPSQRKEESRPPLRAGSTGLAEHRQVGTGLRASDGGLRHSDGPGAEPWRGGGVGAGSEDGPGPGADGDGWGRRAGREAGAGARAAGAEEARAVMEDLLAFRRGIQAALAGLARP